MNDCFQTLKLPAKKVSFLYPLNLHSGITFSLLSTAFCLLNFSFLSSQVQAQIVPDTTLPVNSIVTPSDNINIIEGGTQAGGNLFHSFQQFSVPTNTKAFFNNGLDIQNIFTRVTGNSISNIDGLIRANGVANLFLLNPNGIIFGPNAKLNIGGSFLASTANSFKFADGTEFNGKNPQASPLLTVNLPVGLQYGRNAGDITIQGQGQDFGTKGINGSFSENLNPLEVNSGNTLAFVGGNVIIDGGILQVPGGRVEVGGLAGEGTVEINIDNNSIANLKFPDAVERADILITNKAGINTNDFGGGSITIKARNLDILQNSLLTTGIVSKRGSVDAKAGDINLNATDVIRIASSRIENNLNPSAIGNSGNIKVASGAVYLTDESIISTATFENGNAGNIDLAAKSLISLDNNARLESQIYATGKAGNISVKSDDRIEIKNNSIIISSANSQGLAGAISLEAGKLINISNSQINADSFQGLKEEDFNNIENNQIPNSIILQAGSIDINNSTLSSTLSGTGLAGFVDIIADDNVAIANSSIFSNANQAGGQAGYIYIYSSKLVDIKDSTLTAKSERGLTENEINSENNVDSGASNSNSNTENQPSFGGNINIDAETVNLSSAALSTELAGSGIAGSVAIYADKDVTIANNTNISSNANQAGGKAGYIYIYSGKLADIKDSKITAKSDSGSANLDDLLDSQDQVNTLGKSASQDSNQPSFGGSISIDAETINLSNTTLNTSLSGTGYAGSIGIFANEERVVIENGSSLTSDASNNDPNSPGGGIAGYINISAPNSIEIADSAITAESYGLTEGDANNSVGQIFIEAGKVSISDSTYLSTATFGSATAGNINIVANDSGAGVVDIAGETTTIYSNAVGNATGDAGSIDIQAAEVFIRDGANLITDNNGEKGNAGTITIATATTSLNNNSFIKSESASGNGGDINLISEDLLLLRGESNISTSSGSDQVSGSGGNITIVTKNLVALENSNITANAFSGQGGQIRIDTKGIFGARTRTREELRSLGVNIDGTNQNDGSNVDINIIVRKDLVTSDITAISQQGDPELQGTVEINTPDVDPSAGLLELPPTVVDATKLTASSCRSSDEGQKNQFIVTGRGGLPPNPNEALNDEATWMDLRARGGEQQIRSSVSSSQSSVTHPQMMEAQGWKVNSQGQVELLAQTSTVTPQTSGLTPLQCPAP